MTKGINRFLLVLEYILYISGILFFATGRANSFFTGAPLITYGFAILLAMLVGSLIFFARFEANLLASERTVCILSLLVAAAVHTTIPESLPGSFALSPLYFYYYVIIIMFATLGDGTLLLTAVSFFLVSELGWLATANFWNVHQSVQSKIITAHALFILPDIGYVLAAGIIAYGVAAVRKNDRGKKPVPQATVVTMSSSPNLKKQDTASYMMTPGVVKQDTGSYRMVGPEMGEGKDARDLTRGEELSSVVFFMGRNFNAFSALGFIYDAENRIFKLNSFHSKSMHIVPNVHIPAGVGVVGNLAVEKVSFLCGDLTNYNQTLNYYSAASMDIINSVLAVPILSFQNELLGALVVDSQDKVAFRDNQKEMLNRFAQLAAALITNVRMRYLQEMAAKNSQTFYEAARQFATAQHPDQVLEILFNMIATLTPFYRIIAIDFYPEYTSCSVRKIVSKTDEIKQGFAFPLNDGMYSTAVKNRTTITIDDYEQHRQQHYLFVPAEGANPHVRSLIIIPLFTTETFSRGVISIESQTPGQFAGETGQLLSTLVSNAAVAYQKALLYQKMEMLATIDGLTQLYNHRTFQGMLREEVNRSQRYKRAMSLLIMDIDHFKRFNDTYGHSVGDLVLKEIANCIQRTVRNNDIPARYGGEEFVVIVPETGPEGAMIIGERIRQNIEALVVKTQNETLHVTVSIGCAGLIEHATNQQQLLDFADTAMYYSKEHGRNQITLYNKNMGMNKKNNN